MSIPTQPTSTTIVTQAYKDFGVSSPTSDQISRAISDGIEWVKRDLCELGHAWKFMMKTGFIVTQQGVNNYAVPTDYKKFISARIMDGTRTGTAQSGSTSTMALASSEMAVQADIQGKTLLVTGGSGSSQAAQIATYVPATKVVTFDVILSTAVDSTSTYLVTDTFSPLTEQTVFDLSDLTIPSIQLKPQRVLHDPDSSEGRLMTDYCPDKVYGIALRYYADLLKEDLTSTRYNTFLREACGVLTQGVYVWIMQDDTRYETQLKLYFTKRRSFANRWLYGYDLSKMQMTTGEE